MPEENKPEDQKQNQDIEKTDLKPEGTTPTNDKPQIDTAPPKKEIDIEGLEKTISETVTKQVSQAVLEDIGKKLGLTQEQKEALPTDPQELKKYISEESKKQAESLLSERDKQESDKQKAQEEQLNKGAVAYRSMWTREYSDLAENGRVPKIEKADDPQDPGNQAKARIMNKMREILTENEKNGVDHVPSLWEIAARYPEVLTTETTTGNNVPVSGGGRNMANNMTNYDRIHNTSYEDMVANRQTS